MRLREPQFSPVPLGLPRGLSRTAQESAVEQGGPSCSCHIVNALNEECWAVRLMSGEISGVRTHSLKVGQSALLRVLCCRLPCFRSFL